jgi:hypothetical protein
MELIADRGRRVAIEELNTKAKHNILGGTAARLFKLPPRNAKQAENLRASAISQLDY